VAIPAEWVSFLVERHTGANLINERSLLSLKTDSGLLFLKEVRREKEGEE
jgi:hypothetical protein